MRLIPVVIMTALLHGLAAAWAGTPASTIDRAAVATAHGTRSLLVGATRAGTRVVVVGERGHILLSDDNGSSWRQASVPVSVTLTAVCFADAQHGWAVGHRGVILGSRDGGLTWVRQLDGDALNGMLQQAATGERAFLAKDMAGFAKDGADKPFLDVVCGSGEQVAAVGAYGIGVRSSDGGRTWRVLGGLLAASGLKHINAVARFGEGFVLAGEQGQIFRASGDWSRIEKLAKPYQGSFFGLVVTRGGDLLALGLRGNLYRSSDAGATWVRDSLKSTLTFTAGLLLADGSVVLLDEAGGVWRSGDGRQRFRRESVPGAFPFSGAVQAADGRLVAVGARGFTRFDPPRVSGE